MPKPFVSSARSQRLRLLGKRRGRVRIAIALAANPPPAGDASSLIRRHHQPQPVLSAAPPLPPGPRPS